MLLSLCLDTLDQTRFQNTYEQSHHQFWDFSFWAVFRPSQAPLQSINFFFIFIKAKHFLRCWVIANTLGSPHYLHSWARATMPLGLWRTARPELHRFSGTQSLPWTFQDDSIWKKKTLTHALSFLEQIPEQRANGGCATKAGGPHRASLGCRAPGAAQGCSHPLGHLLLVGEVLACASQKGLHPKVKDSHIALKSHCPS